MSRRWVDVTERALYLRAIPVTANLPQAVVHAVANRLVDREYAPGAQLMTSGKPVPALTLVTDGRLSLVSNGNQIGELAPPQSVGFLNLVARADAPYDAVAQTPVRGLELSAQNLFTLMEDHYPLLLSTIRYTAERLLAEMQELPQEVLGLPPSELPLIVPDRPLNLVETIYCLRALSAFKTTNLNTLMVMAAEMKERRVKAGETLIHIGEQADHTFFILDGWVTCETADGRTFRYGPGTAVGGLETLAARPRWYQARADVDTVCLIGSTDHLLDLIEDDAELGADLASTLGRGLLGLLRMKAAKGQATFAIKREVSSLGAVPVGA